MFPTTVNFSACTRSTILDAGDETCRHSVLGLGMSFFVTERSCVLEHCSKFDNNCGAAKAADAFWCDFRVFNPVKDEAGGAAMVPPCKFSPNHNDPAEYQHFEDCVIINAP